jgi:hypothetical protein
MFVYVYCTRSNGMYMIKMFLLHSNSTKTIVSRYYLNYCFMNSSDDISPSFRYKETCYWNKPPKAICIDTSMKTLKSK